MLSGRCSSSHKSLLVLLPSTWCPAVAQPHRNFSGKALLLSLSAAGIAPLADSPKDRPPIIPATATAEALCSSSRRLIVFGSMPDPSGSFMASLLNVDGQRLAGNILLLEASQRKQAQLRTANSELKTGFINKNPE